ncbi:MAG: trypsin-like peptidase domain-containing protein [Candidatus Competibacter sp.]|jgi:S1-C subfamily serine protease
MKLVSATSMLLIALALATPAGAANQYETIDYYIQQMIAHSSADDVTGVQTFREQLENLRRPETEDSARARPLRQQGSEQLARNNFKEALAAFRQAFIADPADPETAGQLSLAYLRLHRLKEAERLAVYALSLAPTQSATWLTLGEVYGQTGDATRAGGAFANAYRFAKDPAPIAEQLQRLTTANNAAAIQTGAQKALQLGQPVNFKSSPLSSAPAPPPTTASPSGTDPLPPSPVTSARTETPGQRIYRQSIPLTCLIITFRNGKTDNLGSGLLVSSDGLIITNNHVIDKADNLAVRCGERESTASVRKRSKEPDLALLATSLNSKERFVLNEAYSQDLIGRDVFVIGNPYGLEGTFSTGVISGLREIDGVRYIQISAPVSPGNSGGPVILSDGSVIGIAAMGLKMGQNLNFAIASAEVIASSLFDPARMKSQPLGGNH